MNKEFDLIAQQLFHAPSFNELSVEALEKFLTDYPYAAPARLLLARKKILAEAATIPQEVTTAGLYFNNPLWFHWLLNLRESEPEADTDTVTAETTQQAAGENEEETKEEEEKEEVVPVTMEKEPPMVFQSYHTIDYFASQGIRLQQAELGKDKLGQQLKSFTEWLRSMKKLPGGEPEIAKSGEDDHRQQHVISSAAHSIEEKEVVTEAMAEVWSKQGNREKAVETYRKLSLLNPSKSAYFAARIDQLK